MNDIQYFAKIKDSPKPAKSIDCSTGKQSSVPVKGLLQYKPRTFDFQFEFQMYYPRHHRMPQEARAFLLGYARMSSITRTRQRFSYSHLTSDPSPHPII